MRFAVRGRDVWKWLAIAFVAMPLVAWAQSPEEQPDEPPAAESDDSPPQELASEDDAGEASDAEATSDVAETAPAEMPDESSDEPQREAADSTEPSDEAVPDESEQDAAPPAAPPRKRTFAGPSARKSVSPGLLSSPESAPAAGESDLDAASLKGIRPGKTTREDLHANWGTPKAVEKIAGGARETFDVKPFRHVRVTVIENVVESLAIRLEKPISADKIAEVMDLDKSEPVKVFDDQGQLLGQAYPERGVLFGFMPQSQRPLVFQVVIEPLDAQPFLVRAEIRLPSRYAECLADIRQAVELAPDSGRAYWMYARLALEAGELQQAHKMAQKAIELEPAELEYRLVMAKILAASGDYPHAIQQLRDLIDSRKAAPLVVARAYCQLGDCVAAASDRDYQQALKHHMDATKLAEKLVASPSLATRRAAKELMLDAHLSLAHDVGWGRWQHKSTVVPKWVERAAIYADDLMANEEGSREIQLRLCEGALAALAGVSEPPDATKWIRATTEAGGKILEEANDPGYKARIAWRVGLALGDAMEIENARNRPEKALELGKLAIDNIQLGDVAGRELPTHDYLRGKLCFRLGAILSIERADHKQAVTWFDQAVPLLESPVPACAAVDPGRHGEAFVSMGVSYWEVNNRREAVRLTKQGAKLMEHAAAEGLLSRAGLAVPYGNLATMHEQLGELKEAKQFSEMAHRFEEAAPK